MLPEPWNAIRRLLVVRLDNIGDVVLLSSSLRCLRQAFPGSHITLMGTRAGQQLQPMLPWIDEMMVERVIWQDISNRMPQDLARENDLIARVAARSFDAAIIFTSFSQSPHVPAYVCYLAGVPVRAAQSKEFAGGVLTHWIKPLPDNTQQAERNHYLLEQLGFQIGDRAAELVIPDEVQCEADRMLAAAGVSPEQPFLAVVPGASCLARTYSFDRYSAVAAGLAAQSRMPVVLLGSESQRELLSTLPPRAFGNACTKLFGATTVPQYAAVIRRSSMVVCNNSSAVHIADAFGVPMVILYSGSDYEEQWRPRMSAFRILRRPTRCAPCYEFTCPYNMECLAFTPDQVVKAVVDLLSDIGFQNSPRLAASIRVLPDAHQRRALLGPIVESRHHHLRLIRGSLSTE